MAADYVELHCHSAYSFLDGVDPYLWRAAPGVGCDVQQTAAGVAFAVTAAQSRCSLLTTTAYRLTDSSITVEVPPLVGVPDGLVVTLQAVGERDPAVERIELRLAFVTGQGTLASRVGSGSYSLVGAYDPGAARFWRIARRGDSVLFDFSLDGAGFTTMANTAGIGFSTEMMGVEIAVSADSNFVGAATVVVAGYNPP